MIKKIWNFIKSEIEFQKLTQAEKDAEIERRVQDAIYEMQRPYREAEERVQLEVENFKKFKISYAFLAFYPQHSATIKILPIYKPDFNRNDWREIGEGVYKNGDNWCHFNATPYSGSRERIYKKQIIKLCYTDSLDEVSISHWQKNKCQWNKVESSMINRISENAKNFFYA